MNKIDLYKAALNAKLYMQRDWVISAFALTQEDPDAWKTNPFAYRLVKQGNRYFYCATAGEAEEPNLQPVEGEYDPSLPLFNAWEQLEIFAGDIPNLTAPKLTTTYGNLLFNWTMFVHPFGQKVAYQNKRLGPSKIESMILARLEDDPTDDTPLVPQDPLKSPIYVSEYLKCANSATFLSGFSQLWVPADTEKTMTPPPGVAEYKDELYKQYAGRLHDPAVIAEIDAKLVAFDAEYLKGDRGAEGFLITKKARQIVRKKLYLQYGAEPGLEDKVEVDVVKNSLSEGWDLEKIPSMNNAQRAGSFNRGAQTMLGGEAVKWLLRASSNLRVAQEDCGTGLGTPRDFSKEKISGFHGFAVVTPNGYETLTQETEGKYLAKAVMVRSPMFCKLATTDYCTVCVGPRLSLNPTALSAAITAIGSTLMLAFMGAAHSRALETADMDIFNELQ